MTDNRKNEVSLSNVLRPVEMVPLNQSIAPDEIRQLTYDIKIPSIITGLRMLYDENISLICNVPDIRKIQIPMMMVTMTGTPMASDRTHISNMPPKTEMINFSCFVILPSSEKFFAACALMLDRSGTFGRYRIFRTNGKARRIHRPGVIMDINHGSHPKLTPILLSSSVIIELEIMAVMKMALHTELPLAYRIDKYAPIDFPCASSECSATYREID